MNFAILSLTRTGSTAVYRVLAVTAGKAIAYEPEFANAELETVRTTCAELRAHFDGIKHVWDPNGWPFRNREHISTIDRLADPDQWIAANVAVAQAFDRQVILRRRDIFQRTLSDLLGQQTDLWGHVPDSGDPIKDATDYKHTIRDRELQPLDEAVFDWYMKNAWALEDKLIAGIPAETFKVFYHEDLFARDPQALTVWTELADWLDAKIDFDNPAFSNIVSPQAKLNPRENHLLIPNYETLRQRYCPGAQSGDVA